MCVYWGLLYLCLLHTWFLRFFALLLESSLYFLYFISVFEFSLFIFVISAEFYKHDIFHTAGTTEHRIDYVEIWRVVTVHSNYFSYSG